MFYIFSATDRRFRKLHYKDIIELYYSTLCITIKELGSVPEKICSASDFYNQLKHTSKFIYLTFPCTIDVILFNPESLCDNSGDQKDFKLNNLIDTPDIEYKKRTVDFVTDLIELGYI